MTNLLTNLWTARVLAIVGLLAGYIPIAATFDHIGDGQFVLIDSSVHSWYHFFREGVADLTASAVILFIMFAAPKYRNPALWWVMLITMFGLYAPFWGAEIAHLQMAVPALLGCFLAKKHYFNT